MYRPCTYRLYSRQIAFSVSHFPLVCHQLKVSLDKASFLPTSGHISSVSFAWSSSFSQYWNYPDFDSEPFPLCLYFFNKIICIFVALNVVCMPTIPIYSSPTQISFYPPHLRIQVLPRSLSTRCHTDISKWSSRPSIACCLLSHCSLSQLMTGPSSKK